MSGLTTHVLDTALGRPAKNVSVCLAVLDGDGAWQTLAERVTDGDGRVRDLLAGQPLEAKTYRLSFRVGAYFAASGRVSFYPEVDIVFTVCEPSEHHHVPLLLSPFGYTTYRGS